MDNFLDFGRPADQINEGMAVGAVQNLYHVHAAVMRGAPDRRAGKDLLPYSRPHTVRKWKP